MLLAVADTFDMTPGALRLDPNQVEVLDSLATDLELLLSEANDDRWNSEDDVVAESNEEDMHLHGDDIAVAQETSDEAQSTQQADVDFTSLNRVDIQSYQHYQTLLRTSSLITQPIINADEWKRKWAAYFASYPEPSKALQSSQATNHTRPTDKPSLKYINLPRCSVPR